MTPPSSSPATPAHPVPRPAPTGTTRPPRLRRAVVGGALTAALLAAGSLGLLVGIDALTAPSAAAQTVSDTVPAGDEPTTTAAYDTSVITITPRNSDWGVIRVVITTPTGKQLTITQSPSPGDVRYATPYVTVGDGKKYWDGVNTTEAQLVRDEKEGTWQLTPRVPGTFAFQTSAESVRSNSRPEPDVTVNGRRLTETGLRITYTR